MADNTQGRIPTVIADGVHIVYRVNTGSSGKGAATAAPARASGATIATFAGSAANAGMTTNSASSSAARHHDELYRLRSNMATSTMQGSHDQ